ncbi:MAG: hypothetical protein ACXWC9_02185 [Pseudobdellovibrionaceae bacterium]
MSKSGISDVVSLFRFGLFILTIFTLPLAQADRLPLPLFVPVLVHQSSPLKVRTLSSYEMTTTLRLTPDLASQPDLESQMDWQFRKLFQLMPKRAAKLLKQWKDLSKDLSAIQMDISLPPGIDWNEWATPHNEELRPVAVVHFSIDGRRLFYIDKILFPALTASDQAQVLWQLLWTTELGNDDNLKIRTITNYLFSKQWLELKTAKALSIFKKFEFDYFEAQGFCFQFDSQLQLHPNGHVKTGTASENCVVKYDDQEVIFRGPLVLSEDGRLISLFRVSEKTPWTVFWEGHYLEFDLVQLYPDKGLKSATFASSLHNRCANHEGPISVQTGYAKLDFECLRDLQLFPNGVIERVSIAEALVSVRGNVILVGRKQPLELYDLGQLSFYENGTIRSALFPVGSKLESFYGNTIELKQIRFLMLNEDGLVVSPEDE